MRRFWFIRAMPPTAISRMPLARLNEVIMGPGYGDVPLSDPGGCGAVVPIYRPTGAAR